MRNSLGVKNRIFDKVYNIDYDLRKEFFEEFFKSFDIFVPKDPTRIEEDIKIKLTNMLLEANEKTKIRNKQVEIIEIMSKEEKMDILKARFGEKISSSNSSVLPPWHDVYKKYDGKSINENLPSDIFKECVDLEYTQIKIIELIEAKMRIGEYEQNVTTIGEIEIKELRFSRHTFNCLCVNGIFTVQDLVARTEEELLKIRHFGKNSFDEVLKKVQSLGIQMKDGHFDNSNLNNVLESEVANNLEKVKEIEKLINSSEYISEEKKKELKKMLYKLFNITIDEDKDLEERSKEELIEHLLEQQKTIAEQCEEIDELSSKKMEEV